MDACNKFTASLMGLAVCDALGTAVEFMPRGSFEDVVDMRGGGKFDLLPGQWTDDTSMALCLSESLIECGGFNPTDQATRYYQWFEEGHLSSTGECFDIGMTTQKALYAFKRSGDPFSGPTSDRAAGNGCLMRLAPIPLAYCRHPVSAIKLAGESAKITHGASIAVDGCKYYAALIVGCLQNASKDELLTSNFTPSGVSTDYWSNNTLCNEISSIANGSYKTKSRSEISSGGYIVHSMEAALWAFYNSKTFEEGALLAVNLGDDADTVGAIYGQLAGAYYGDIPQQWTNITMFSSLINMFAAELFELSGNINTSTNHKQVSHDHFSKRYKEMKIDYFDNLEKESKQILRRSNPCPKQFKSLEDFDAAVEQVRMKYLKEKNEWSCKIISDYNKQWSKLRDKLALRLTRKL